MIATKEKTHNPIAIMSSSLRVACAIALLVLGGCVIKPPQADRTVDGLQRKPSKRVDVVYTAPGTSLANYRRIILDPVDVAFKKDWQRAHPEVTAADIERIRAEAAALFRTVFAEELDGKGGYELVDAAAPDVLRVNASIVDLDLAAPGALSTDSSRTYVVSLGEMTLLGELRDSVSGAILVRVADRERGREFGNLRVVNSVTTSAEASRAFAMWAGLLREALDAAKSAPEGA